MHTPTLNINIVFINYINKDNTERKLKSEEN